jgi:hypothetical protein
MEDVTGPVQEAGWQELEAADRMTGFRGAESVFRDGEGQGDRLLACWDHDQFSGWAVYTLRNDGKTNSKTWKYDSTVGTAAESPAIVIERFGEKEPKPGQPATRQQEGPC